jgi:hypothetical protein
MKAATISVPQRRRNGTCQSEVACRGAEERFLQSVVRLEAS